MYKLKLGTTGRSVSAWRSLTRAAVLILAIGLPATGQADDAGDQFFSQLKEICGARFEGAITFPTEGQDSFAGKLLVATIEDCGNAEIRVPFAVGEDHSRTWIFSRTTDGLQLKHDHRHADGTPDEVTMYGGMAGDGGTSLVQSFAADAYTADLIPAAATNVWTVSLNQGRTQITYYLERNSAPRFRAVLKRVP